MWVTTATLKPTEQKCQRLAINLKQFYYASMCYSITLVIN
ncbi:hypothetical protein PPEP_a0727 [Pseudoalteromonas peptidolytica F12-50-A1]|uniref:Uncharacterized protein n=1 Tax=Pseudoalteromonas peptidolytica F12-50-A1 TaxID=1315280 RepID=A0A8I0MUM2_9GAMM|nr:hypothetical protein [Pseudoalteromonas peptidolytica F12-50-A1]